MGIPENTILRYVRSAYVKIRRRLFISFPKLELIFDKGRKKKLLSELKGADKVNFGCGDDLIDGWVNITLREEEILPYGVIIKAGNNALLLNFNLKKEFPFSDDCIQYLYSSHFIEHLDFEEGWIFLRKCYKIMKKAGLIRLVFPDLERWVRKYIENDKEFFSKYDNIYNTEIYKNKLSLKTKGEIFSSQICGFQHKWCYDFESIKDIMERAGFLNVTKRAPCASSMPGIRELESKEQGRLMESLYVEGQK